MGIEMQQEPESIQLKQAAIGAVLASRTFAKSPNLARLLEYICTKYLEGSAPDLKEYNIGIDALGRPPGFDPTKNAIVRVEVYRLREKLKKYYQSEGKEDTFVISLPPGSYIPQFTRRDQLGAEEEEKPPRKSRSEPLVVYSGPQPPAVTQAPATLVINGNGFWPRLLLALKHPSKLYLIIIAALVIGVVALATRRSGSLPTTPLAGPARHVAASPAPALVRQAVRIVAGYNKAQYIDRAGHIWLGDRDFEGGAEGSQTQVYIARTFDPTLFRTLRFGDFAYNIPLQPGTYELRLYFSETTYGPDTLAGGGEGSRVFSVTANGKLLLSNFDVICDAGGADIADVKVFKDISPGPDGYLRLRFIRQASDPFVDAIELIPSEPGRINPIRITAQEDCFTDHASRFWSADRYFMGGRLAVRKIPVSNTLDPGLFNGERYGNFTYAIPVAEGKYKLTLEFAETYFGPHNTGGGGVGSRIFDVYCNGTALLRNFDVYKQAGAENRALEETFSGLRPNAQGKLLLHFVPIVNYASVNAIEVTDESR